MKYYLAGVVSIEFCAHCAARIPSSLTPRRKFGSWKPNIVEYMLEWILEILLSFDNNII